MKTTFVGLIVTDYYEGNGHRDNDTPAVIEALFQQGIIATPIVWHDKQIDWSLLDAVIIRSPWDYSNRFSEFEAWLQFVSMQTCVFNSPKLIKWNLNKHYLDELHLSGIPIIPTLYCNNIDEVKTSVHSFSSHWQVIKPTVSAGSRNTGLFHRDDEALYILAEHIIAASKEVMIQPEIAALSTGQEKSLFYFGGRFSHAVTKGALLAHGGGFLNGSYKESPRPIIATTDELILGDITMASICDIGNKHQWAEEGYNPPVYARLDVVIDEDYGPLLVEAELFEPSLYVHDNPQAARQYAKAIANQLLKMEH